MKIMLILCILQGMEYSFYIVSCTKLVAFTVSCKNADSKCVYLSVGLNSSPFLKPVCYGGALLSVSMGKEVGH